MYSDYFGVRNLANKNAEGGSDQQIITIVQEMENKYNYSVSSLLYDARKAKIQFVSFQGAIINLLGQAMTQFKIYRCGRERKKCAVMMADEYFKCGEYTKALT